MSKKGIMNIIIGSITGSMIGVFIINWFIPYIPYMTGRRYYDRFLRD